MPNRSMSPSPLLLQIVTILLKLRIYINSKRLFPLNANNINSIQCTWYITDNSTTQTIIIYHQFMGVNIVESLSPPIQRGPFTSENPFEERHHVTFPSTTSYPIYSTHKSQRNTSSDITPRLFGYIREVNASYAIIESDSVFYKRHL